MGLISKIIGMDNVVNQGFGIVDKLVVDKDLKMQIKADFDQLAIKHRSPFVAIFLAGPKPALMWISVLGFAQHYIINPYLHALNVEVLPMDAQSLYALAGIGSASIAGRVVEKVKKATGNHF